MHGPCHVKAHILTKILLNQSDVRQDCVSPSQATKMVHASKHGPSHPVGRVLS